MYKYTYSLYSICLEDEHSGMYHYYAAFILFFEAMHGNTYLQYCN